MITHFIYLSMTVLFMATKIFNLINHRIVGQLVPQWHLLYNSLGFLEDEGKSRQEKRIYFYLLSIPIYVSLNSYYQSISSNTAFPHLSILFILGPHSILNYSQTFFHICYLLTFWIISRIIFLYINFFFNNVHLL